MQASERRGRPSAKVGIEAEGRHIDRTTLLRLGGYYAIALGTVALFVSVTRTGPAVWSVAAPFWPTSTAPGGSLALLLEGAMALAGAVLLAVPLAFVYVRTRSKPNYDSSLVQTVIMLPVVVTAILIVVRNSLALALSLAGIVTAVRFRNNLKDSRDAVYILAALGVGLAAGVWALPIAALLSLAFTVLELILWKVDLTADHEKTFCLLCVPAPRHAAIDADAAAPGNGRGPARAAPPGGNGDDRGDDKKKARLRVYATGSPSARGVVERVLDGSVKRWKLKDERSSGVDQVVFDYSVRLGREPAPAHLLARLYAEGGPHVVAAEIVDGRAN